MTLMMAVERERDNNDDDSNATIKIKREIGEGAG